MKKLFFMLWGVAALGLVSVSVKAEERLEHYAGKEFTSVEQAKEALVKTSRAMADVVDDAELDVTKMEQVHETSYTTENAVAYLDKETEANLKLLVEKLEAVHLSSEGHKTEALRRHYVSYQAELAEYLAR